MTDHGYNKKPRKLPPLSPDMRGDLGIAALPGPRSIHDPGSIPHRVNRHPAAVQQKVFLSLGMGLNTGGVVDIAWGRSI